MSTIDQQNSGIAKRRPHTFTVRADLMGEAKALRLNASRAAEAGIEAAVRKAKEQAWLEQNKAAIEAYNERIDREGTLLKPIWLKD